MGFSFTTALTVANSPCMKALRSRMGPTGRATAVAAVTDDVAAFDMIVEDAFTGAFAVAAFTFNGAAFAAFTFKRGSSFTAGSIGDIGAIGNMGCVLIFCSFSGNFCELRTVF